MYDSGDYAGGLDRALELSEYGVWRDKQRVERARGESGRLLGIGLAAYVMLTGLGPHESSLLRVDPSGKITLVTGATFASGLHVAVVEVDRDTLEVTILLYAVVSDAGALINPLIVEGQIVGGVAQGIGGALYEELAYDRQGNFLSQTLLDYCMPSATQIPPVRIAHLHRPSPLNPLGVKGLGEGGAMAPPAAIANAVEDALGHLGVRIDSTPVTPTRLAALLQR